MGEILINTDLQFTILMIVSLFGFLDIWTSFLLSCLRRPEVGGGVQQHGQGLF